MRLDVVLPTYNRAAMLRRALDSLIEAPIPAGMAVRIFAVDNNSTDNTREVIAEYAGGAFAVEYVFEQVPGRSAALNAGIAAGDGDVVGMIDDDEWIDPGWYAAIHKWMSDPGIDFIGGSCFPDWETPPPNWLPPAYNGVIGKVDAVTLPMEFGPNYPGILTGGNAVIRRAVLERIGPYATDVGRVRDGFASCEDEDMYRRLLAAGARGTYLPSLTIHHWVPTSRLTRRYYRRWAFGRGVSKAILDQRNPEPVVYLAGVPRYLFGTTLRCTWDSIHRTLTQRRQPDVMFANELSWWDLAGFLAGKLFSLRRSNDTQVAVGRS